MLTLIGKHSSINVRKVLWCLDIIGVKFKHLESLSKDELIRLNPNALVPVLIVRDVPLWQSNTILRYLGNEFSSVNLYPTDSFQRAKTDQWLDWQATEFNNAWGYAFQAMIRENPDFQAANKIADSVKTWHHCVSILNQHLTDNTFAIGEHFTIADIALALSINRWYHAIGKQKMFPAVDRYFESCRRTPGFSRWVANGVP